MYVTLTSLSTIFFFKYDYFQVVKPLKMMFSLPDLTSRECRHLWEKYKYLQLQKLLRETASQIRPEYTIRQEVSTCKYFYLLWLTIETSRFSTRTETYSW